MKLIYTFFAVLLVNFYVISQSGHYCAQHKIEHFSSDRSASLSLDQIAQTEEYDVHFYFLDIAVNNDAVDVDGRVEIHAKSNVAVLDTFLVELHEDLTLTDVKLNGITSVPFTRMASAVIVPCSFGLGDNFYYEFIYGGTPPSSGSTPFGGGGMSNDFSGSWGNQVTWTLSEPFSAYEWFVCKQSLTDKADSVYVYITCDSTNMAGSQGLLVNVVNVAPDQKRFEWQSRYPIDYYLISISVAEYVDYSYYANPIGAPSPVLIQNFVYDNPATLPFFMSEINKTGDFLEYYSELFGIYPFHAEKYGHCMAPFGGGMEHQTMTSQGWFESGLTAHELGHQWFGDNVTCGSWSDIWLNEGFASYCEELMMEEFSPGDEITQMQDRHDNIMSQPGGSVWVEDSLNPNRIFSGRLTYDKGAAIIHTLRFLINDDATFFYMLEYYQAIYGNGTAVLADFKANAEAISGLDLDNFFSEWYYGEGFPTYNLEYNRVGSTVFVEVDQDVSMPAITPYFTNDLELKITGVDGFVDIVRLSSIVGSTTLHSFSFPEDIASIEIDPNNWIINENGTITENVNLVSVSEEYTAELSLFPNPTSGIVMVNSNAKTTYSIINAVGQKVKEGYFVEGSNQIDLSSLDQGVYLIKAGNRVYRVVKQ